jgi:phosphohistidine phosphatase SixA
MLRSLLALCLVTLWASTAQAAEAEAWQALREGRAVLILRHANAPGLGDPAGFRLNDCRTQRNLDQAGRQQAQRWGQLLRSQGIEPLRLLSSRWCRAQDTASEMALAAVEALPELDSFFAQPRRGAEKTSQLLAQINAQPRGVPLVLVSHQVNITALSGIFPASGEGLILALPLSQPARILGRVAAP